jgi:glutaredoxin-related protein
MDSLSVSGFSKQSIQYISIKDIRALIREVKRNVKAADAVRRAIPHSKVYGWPKFFRLYIEKIHGEK